MPNVSADSARGLCRRLWKGGGLVAVFLLTIIVGNFFIPRDKAVTQRMLGHDFLAFYYGGSCVLTGHPELLYDLNSSRAFEQKLGQSADLDIGPAFGPWWNPPFAALLFVPLAALPYHAALAVWWIFGGCCLVATITLLMGMLPGPWQIKLLVPLFILTSMPFYQAASHGQNTFFSMLLLTITVVLWRGGKTMWAGLVCGLMFYKPQLGAVVAAVLCVSAGRRAILGVLITGMVLLLLNVIFLPGTLHDWLVRVPQNLAFMQEQNHYRWERHVTLKGFWRLAIQGWENGPTALSAKILWGISEAILAWGLLLVTHKTWREGMTSSGRDRLIAAAIVSMPLLMPFYFDYDLLLISVAVTVYASQRLHNPTDANWEDKWIIRVFGAMLVCLLFATMLAGVIRLLVTIPLLATAAGLLIRRGLRDEPAAQIPSVEVPDAFPPAARAA